jgi:hypothetical protein
MLIPKITHEKRMPLNIKPMEKRLLSNTRETMPLIILGIRR